MYSYRVEQAIRAAAILHKDQVRKGSVPYPYITHLVAVSMILLDYTQDEDTIIAALLHDTLEDTDYTITELQEDFGGKVREIVESLSEPTGKHGERLSWRDKKSVYAKQLKKAPDEALMIAAADKAHNMRSMVEEYFDDHQRFLKDFGSKIDDRIELYQNISNVINNRLSGGILHEFNHVFDEYKNFVFNVKKSQENGF